MRLFDNDLFRTFAIGFVLGTGLVLGSNSDNWAAAFSPPARAAAMPEVVQPTAEFLIQTPEPR